jgi:hypothetical protein
MPRRTQPLPQSLTDTAQAAALCVRAYRDDSQADRDAATLVLLPIVADLEKTFALVTHLASIAVGASTPEALEKRLAITDRIGR